MKARKILSVVALMFMPLYQLLAWNATGHMIVASIAYNNLPSEAKQYMLGLLESHPRYERWAESVPTDIDRGEYIFMRASIWPDEIRRTGNPYDHPEWHYIDYPVRPPAFKFTKAPDAEDHILHAIDECWEIVYDESVEAESRAAHLSWLIHLVGDIHQPLHCATLVNSTYPAPEGDRGGNSFFIRISNSPVKLHSFWDGLLGKEKNHRKIANAATAIVNKFETGSLMELDSETTPAEWSKKSRQLAIDKAYLRGKLSGSPDKKKAPVAPSSYSGDSKKCAEKQVVLAGYRLADLINGIHDEIMQ